LEELQHALWKKFLLVKAAGGLVLNEKEEVLLIFRRGKWDMPKGKLDPGESLDFCALREVEEETGLGNLQLKEHLITTYHTYDESGKHILKESHWYRIHAKGEQVLTPQTEEEITEVRWVPPKQLKNYQLETFPSIIQVWQKAGYL
ncbi:MAG TPA: NUDIX domain-containing protein, partial [Chitinophagaceae bacterium]|nr:NUDIX domain-containing protein [Chitinophagaceae bacterium]